MAEFFDEVGRFFRQSILSFKALFGWLDPKIYILVKIINPVFQLIFFCLLAKHAYKVSDVTPWVVGNALLLCTYNAMFGVGTVLLDERSFGTLKTVIASPSSKFLVFTGRASMHVFDAALTVIIGFSAGAAAFGVSFKGVNILLLILVILTAMFSASGMGLLIGSLGLRIRDMNLVLNISAMGLLALSGANFPIDRLPLILQKLSYAIPLTRSVKAARLVMSGEGLYTIGGLILGEILIGTAYLLLGYILLRIMETLARKTASLDIY